MKLDLSEIARTVGMHAEVDIDEPGMPKEEGAESAGHIKGRINVSNTGSLLVITGKVSAGLNFECSRCLAPFTMPVEAEIEEDLKLEKVGDTIQALPLDEDESDIEIIKNNILDVHELVRQNLVLELPIRPICSEDCKGLCPTCGTNLNVRKCKCIPSETQSPFAALADLIKKDEETS